MTQIRSRRAGISPEEAALRPLYAKLLGLQYLRPSSLVCFMFFEGTIALGGLLALAELTAWWVVLVLPVSVALMVKVNDVIAGASIIAGASLIPKARGRARVPRRTTSALDGVEPVSPGSTEEWHGSPEQRARQSAMRRYE